jgi:uncharacterized protein (UPF0333 family)
MNTTVINRRHRDNNKGISTLEFALMFPILLTLVIGVVEFSRALQYNNIIANISREGANLASRTLVAPPTIISVLTFTASPLDMKNHGVMYISKIKGVDGGNNTIVSVIDSQQRSQASEGNTNLASKLWACPSWEFSSCVVPSSINGKTVALPFPLAIGSDVYYVEIAYEYVPFSGYLIQENLDLYSFTLL